MLAADQFVIEHDGPTAVAGYPWFGEWSRDLMTSYEGLFLSTGRAEEGREALRRAAATLSGGMLANTADTGTLEYNTVDGTLWFVHALGRHVEVTGDEDLGSELAPALSDIVARHLSGTRFGIGADADGLLRGGEDGWALTWMDARIDGVPVTPRIGKPVEVNGLWIQALELAGRLGRTDRWRRTHETARASFVERFVRSDGQGLLDLVDGPGGDDGALRPNQLLAVSLPGGPLASAADRDAARAVVEACAPLVTPLGLRSLAPDDPAYRPRHRGSPAERDCAYHQGTVWPWLIGPYVDAARRVGASTDELLDGPFGPPRRVGPRLGLRDRGRRRAARRDRLPVPGLVGRRAPPRPSRRCVDAEDAASSRRRGVVEGSCLHLFERGIDGRRDARQTLRSRRERDALRRRRLLGDARSASISWSAG